MSWIKKPPVPYEGASSFEGRPRTVNDLIPCPFCQALASPHWRAVSFWRCSRCGLLFRNPQPSEASIAQLYEESWSDPQRHTNETGGTDLDLARIYARKLAGSLGRNDFGGLRILDHGAGRGSMLTALEELGAEVHALEPFGGEYLRQQGFRTFRNVDELPEGLSFDGIVSIDVIEHLAMPWSELTRFKSILTETGWVYIATPNANGLNARLFGSEWREALKAGHLVFFTPRSLGLALRHCGYTCHRRLKWFFGYSRSYIRTGRDYLLQSLRLDGELRYLAFKEAKR